MSKESVKLFSALQSIEKPVVIKGFPKVTVDQTNFRISQVIKRNIAGEQVMGNNNLSFDFEDSSKEPDYDKVNPFSDIGFDLDDVIALAHKTGQQVSDLQNRQGELKQALDQAKQEEAEKNKPALSPAPAPAPSPEGA